MSVAPTPPPAKPEEPRPVIDMSKMNEGQRAALQVTEAARETVDDLSFVAHLFMGRWRPDKIAPVTEVDAEEKARADKLPPGVTHFCARRSIHRSLTMTRSSKIFHSPDIWRLLLDICQAYVTLNPSRI